MTHKKYQPTEAQKDASKIETSRVQFWRRGIMVTAMMTRETAQRIVAEGNAYVISGQAIGAMENGYSDS